MLSIAFALRGFFEEAWEYIYNTYFNPDLTQYEHIGIGDGGLLSLQSIVFGLLIGFFIASCMTVFDRHVLGDFVRHMLYNECLSRESAKTLSELGYLKNSIIRGSLKRGVSLRRVVKCVEEEDFNAEVQRMREEYEAATAGTKALRFKEPKFEMDVSTAHFYIPEELKYMADVKFEKKGSGVRTLIFCFVIFIVLAFLAFFIIPELLQMLDNLIGMFDPKNNIVT